ncbi:MAG: hypothetical protein COA79_20290 [Planctomycetota bacterium]|nr:MAG: hypothetical protein COA79_20290 [Planctomycetota bacterium]
MMKDILLSEFAKLIINKPQLIRESLDAANLPAPANQTTEELVASVSLGLMRSKKFAKLLTEDILKSDAELNADGTVSAPAKKKISGSGILAGLTAGAAIISGIGSLFGGTKKAEAANASSAAAAAAANQAAVKANAQAQAALAAQAAGLSAMNKTGDNIGLYIGLGVGALLLIGGAIYYYVKVVKGN